MKYSNLPQPAGRLRTSPPRGGRGLKSLGSVGGEATDEVAPPRGAWIEILAVGAEVVTAYVAPLAGGVD